jgi:hypothetical protein
LVQISIAAIEKRALDGAVISKAAEGVTVAQLEGKRLPWRPGLFADLMETFAFSSRSRGGAPANRHAVRAVELSPEQALTRLAP